MNTIKENKDITKKEARIIQYGKILLGLIFGLYICTLLTIIATKL